MFDIGWSELLIIGVVALIVVGPKDLPKMFRTLGQFTAKLRGMAREFSRAMEAAADETGVKDVAKTFRETASGKTLRDAAGFDEIEKDFRDIGRDIGRDRPSAAPASSPGSSPLGGPKPPLGPVSAPQVDPDTAARNAALTETEAERLKRAERAAEARRQAAEIRARREAEAQPAPPQTPPAPPPASQG